MKNMSTPAAPEAPRVVWRRKLNHAMVLYAIGIAFGILGIAFGDLMLLISAVLFELIAIGITLHHWRLYKTAIGSDRRKAN